MMQNSADSFCIAYVECSATPDKSTFFVSTPYAITVSFVFLFRSYANNETTFAYQTRYACSLGKEYQNPCGKHRGHHQEYGKKRIHLTLHPKKIYLQHYSKGVKFCGAVIKPYRSYMQKKTLGRWQQKLANITPQDVDNYDKLQKVIAMINSYLGMIKHHRSYKIRKKILQGLPPFLANKLIYKSNYTKVVPRARRLRKAEIKLWKKRKYF